MTPGTAGSASRFVGGGKNSPALNAARTAAMSTTTTRGGQGSSQGSLANLEDERIEADHSAEEEEPEEEDAKSESSRRSQNVTSPFKRPESNVSNTSSTTFGYTGGSGGGGGGGGGEEDPLSLRGNDSRKMAAEAVSFRILQSFFRPSTCPRIERYLLRETSVRCTDDGCSFRSIAFQMVSKREYDSLFTRLQILERRRNEDRERLRDLERLKDEEGEWEKVREKIKGRLEVVVGEGKELKREVRVELLLFSRVEGIRQLIREGSE